jgi:hypothetical protein
MRRARIGLYSARSINKTLIFFREREKRRNCIHFQECRQTIKKKANNQNNHNKDSQHEIEFISYTQSIKNIERMINTLVI